MEPFGLFFAGVLATCLLIWARSRYLSFEAQEPAEYKELGPQIDLREHLSGPILCEGVIYGPTGRITTRFVADMEATWTGNTGVMKEHFRYDSGTTQEREWRLTLGNDGKIKAEADDVVGTGTGEISGSTIKLNYKFRLPEESGGHVLDTTDWMYMVENGTIINHSQFRKFGVKVAELVATFRRKEVA